MEAGQLRERVTLQEPTVVVDSFGQPVKTWVTLATLWAAVIPVSGRELIASEAEHAEITVRVIIRYRGEIDATMRFLHRGMVYEIKAPPINKDMRNREIEVLCAQGMSEG